MLTFRPLSLSDKQSLNNRTLREPSRSVDYSFGAIFLWSGKYHHQVADCAGYPVLMCSIRDDKYFSYPIGCDDLQSVVSEILAYAAANNFPPILIGLEDNQVEALEQQFPGRFSFTPERDFFDYIYSIEKLITLSGKRLHAKRNHCNRFESEHDWQFLPLAPEHFPACLALLDRWSESERDGKATLGGERIAIELAFAHYDALELLGGALFAEGELVGFAIGERISPDTFDIHFEKARADINGAYSMINREFAKLIAKEFPDVHYVNREEDMGLENLRRSKLSYYPEILLQKFTAQLKEVL